MGINYGKILFFFSDNFKACDIPSPPPPPPPPPPEKKKKKKKRGSIVTETAFGTKKVLPWRAKGESSSCGSNLLRKKIGTFHLLLLGNNLLELTVGHLEKDFPQLRFLVCEWFSKTLNSF